MYAALRLQAVQFRVTRPPGASSLLERSGKRWTAIEPQEGQTKGLWSRSAAIRISASGARYSLIPRRPTVGPSGGALVARIWLDPTSSKYGIFRCRAKFGTCVPEAFHVPHVQAAHPLLCRVGLPY